MLKIRETQFGSLVEPALEDFAERLREVLRRRLPARTEALDETALRERTLRSLRVAYSHGVLSERALADWVILDLTCGSDFPAQSWARAEIEAAGPCWSPAGGQDLHRGNALVAALIAAAIHER
ncbi:MAG: hypothetical protein AAGF11_09955 [Myxococcota bacterium]